MKLLPAFALFAAWLLCAALRSQDVALELVPSAQEIDGCPGEPFFVTVRLSNPARREIGGYQLFLRFQPHYFGAVRFDPIAVAGTVKTGGREPFGEGYLPCTGKVGDPWGDLAGEDVVSVVASVLGSGSGGEGPPPPFTEANADLGRFVFEPLGAATEAGGAVFKSNEETCHVPFDQTTKVFGRNGESLSAGAPASFAVVVRDGGPFVKSFLCLDQGDSVKLTWDPPQGNVAGYRIFRNGSLLTELSVRGIFELVDSNPPSGTVLYEIAVLLQAQKEGCRDSCSLERRARFIRGDANRDRKVNITDAVTVLAYLFQGGSITCEDAADGDDNGRLVLTDAVAILNHLFQGAGDLPPPFPAPGSDPTPDDLTCEI